MLIKRPKWLKRKGSKQRGLGDTLIEVSIALSILSMVLLSVVMLTTRAFQVGQTARERTTLVNEAQEQMEILRNFRDTNTWDKFLYGSTTAPTYPGVLTMNSSTDCRATAPCWHMVPGGGSNPYVPDMGKAMGTVPTSYIEFAVMPNVEAGVVRSVEVTLSYGAEGLGSVPAMTGHLKTNFTNLAYAPTPGPPTTPPCGNSPKDVVLVLDASRSMSNSWAGQKRSTRVKAAAKTLIDGLNIGPGATQNRLALLTFVSYTESNQGFTTDVAQAQSYLAPYSDTVKVGTYFSHVLGDVATKFNSSPRVGAEKVVIFLTDGELTTTPIGGAPQPPDNWPAATTATNTLKYGMNARIYTIGVGNVNQNAINQLTAMANGSGGSYGDADDQAGLDSIMLALTYALGC